MLIDTHCHIHEESYPLNSDEVIVRAGSYGVNKMICVGTDEKSSTQAVEFSLTRDNCWASVGLHPHDAKNGAIGIEVLRKLLSDGAMSESSKIVAIGECGLDYYYDNSPRDQQADMLHAQIELAIEYNLPLIFHVREAFDDFWHIFEQYKGLRGVLHSYTDTVENLEKALSHDLFIGVNGISTFTKVESQQKMFAAIPLKNLLLETDAPFLTPTPKRGTVNEPAFVSMVAQKQADLRFIPLEELSVATSQNATRLFSF